MGCSSALLTFFRHLYCSVMMKKAASQVLGLDVLRAERVVSAGHDHTCRVWKVPEETQLIFRAHAMALDCCRHAPSAYS